jgi:glycosyltransferase involved in cell wall biosynthesis
VIARRAFRQAGAVTACSGDLLRRALALGATASRTRVVPYGVDVQAFSPQTTAAGVRERLGIPPDALLVLAFGRLVEKKGFAYLVDAASRTGGIVVVIAGEGDLRARLETQARQARVDVRLVGALDRTTIAGALATADVVVVPSVVDQAGNVDGLPNALLEAMAAGRPVVASRVAGIPDVVQDDVNGLLVPPKDAASLAGALRRLVREPEARRRLGEQARRTALERLSWDATARAFEEAYAQAAALVAR